MIVSLRSHFCKRSIDICGSHDVTEINVVVVVVTLKACPHFWPRLLRRLPPEQPGPCRFYNNNEGLTKVEQMPIKGLTYVKQRPIKGLTYVLPMSNKCRTNIERMKNYRYGVDNTVNKKGK